MKANVVKEKPWKRSIEIEIAVEEFNAVFQEKLNSYCRNIKLDGFRVGKVPKEIILTRFGKSIRSEAIEAIIKDSFEQVCQQYNIVPVCPARITELKDSEGSPITFKIETEVEPEIEIKGYHDLSIRPSPDKVKQSDIDKVIEELRERFSQYQDVDRKAKKGDYLTIEYKKAIIDDEHPLELSNPKYPIELGASKFKDFEKGLIGCSAGETVELDIKIPKDYDDPDLASKKAKICVLVKKVQEKILPPLDLDFLKKVGDYNSLEELQEEIRKNLEEKWLEQAKNRAYNEAIDALIKANPFDVPPTLVERYIDYLVEEASKYVKQGQPPPSREEFAERYRETAIRAIKRQRIIDFIAKKEKITATQQEIGQQIRRLVDLYKQPFEKIENVLKERIAEDIKEQKTLDFLIGEYRPESNNSQTGYTA